MKLRTILSLLLCLSLCLCAFSAAFADVGNAELTSLSIPQKNVKKF